MIYAPENSTIKLFIRIDSSNVIIWVNLQSAVFSQVNLNLKLSMLNLHLICNWTYEFLYSFSMLNLNLLGRRQLINNKLI